MYGTPTHMCICKHTHPHTHKFLTQLCKRTKHILHKVKKKKIRFPRNPLVLPGKIGAIFKMPACLWKSAGKLLMYIWDYFSTYVCMCNKKFSLFRLKLSISTWRSWVRIMLSSNSKSKNTRRCASWWMPIVIERLVPFTIALNMPTLHTYHISFHIPSAGTFHASRQISIRRTADQWKRYTDLTGNGGGWHDWGLPAANWRQQDNRSQSKILKATIFHWYTPTHTHTNTAQVLISVD